MRHEILYKPSYALLRINLDQNEEVVTEAGSMVSMSSNMDVKTSLNTSHNSSQGAFSKLFSFLFGFFIALSRKVFGGETLFINTYTPKNGSGEILLAPTVSGDIIHRSLENEKITIQADSYLASDPSISIKLKFGGIKALFSGEGLFFLECAGSGNLWINSFGAIEERYVDGSMSVDTGHVVAFDTSLSYSIKAVGNLKSTFFSGEGLIMNFKGTGRLWIQTRSVNGFVGWVNPLLPNK